MIVQYEIGHPEGPLFQIIWRLLDRFPLSAELDYFNLCQVDPLCTVVPISARDKFNLLSGYLRLLASKGIIEADHFTDGAMVFYWNVVLTVEGFRRTLKLFADRQRDSYYDDRRLLLDLCFETT